MKLVIFGLSISSSWGNGHATLWRGLVEALHRRDCRVTFFERDTPYYAGARDMTEMNSAHLVIYPDWDTIVPRAKKAIALCEIARALLDDGSYRIGRVIARPFVGRRVDDFVRTGNPRDYAVPPPGPTLLDRATVDGRDVVSIGKIADIFAHSGTGRVLKAHGNENIFARTIEGAASLSDGGLLVSNFIDFDSEYGHRRDIPGYAAALERLDAVLPRLFDVMRADDLLVITADHGCDPTWHGTDHTREQVPVLCYSQSLTPGCIGRFPYGGVAGRIADHLKIGGSAL